MTLVLAHLTDLHFGEAPEALVEAMRADLLAQRPDAVLVSGDLTLRARPLEFAAAWRFLDSLALPVMAVPGNHDIPARNLFGRFHHPRRGWLASMPASAPSELALPGLSVIGLDTVRRAQWHMDWSAGGVSQARRVALGIALQARRETRCIVLCHHPMRHPGGMAHRHLPAGAAATLRMLADLGVEALLSGHLHVAALLPGEGPLQVITPSAFSPRGGRPNGWTLVQVGAGATRYRTRNYVGGSWHDAVVPQVSAA